MFKKVFSFCQVPTAFFAEQDGRAKICYFHLVASRAAAYHRWRRNNKRYCHLDGHQLEALPEHTNFNILDSRILHTLTPQLQSDLENSHLSQAAGHWCASVLPEREPDSWAANLCFPAQNKLQNMERSQMCLNCSSTCQFKTSEKWDISKGCSSPDYRNSTSGASPLKESPFIQAKQIVDKTGRL